MRGDAEQRREKILNGRIIPTVLSLAWPVVVGSMLQAAYNLADTFWLGRVSAAAVAAPTTSFPIIMVLNALGMGLATAGISLVSQHTGAGGGERANEAAGQVFGLLFVISVVGGAVGFASSGWLLANVVGARGAVYPLAHDYIRIVFAGAPLMFAFIAFRFVLRGTGDMKTPMYIRAIAVLLNVVVDPLLILGIGPFPEWGVAGAAVATVATRGFAAAIGLYLLFAGRVDIELSVSDLWLRWRWVKKVLDIGLPSSAARVGSALGFVGLMALIYAFGPVVPPAAYGVGQRVIQMTNLGIWGFAGAATTMVGQNVGADQQSRAERIVRRTLLVSAAVMIVLSVGIYLGREPLVAVFLSPDLEKFGAVVAEASRFIAIFVVSIPFFGWFRIFDSTYRGTGHTKAAMAFSLSRILVMRLGFSYLLAFPAGGYGLDLGLVGIWIGMTVSNVASAGLSYLYFRTGRWKEKTIEDSEAVAA
ncbi:MAG: MATE family efflux transporter [Halobacteriales archaeon]